VILDANGKPEFHQLRGRCAIRDPGRIGRAAVSKPAAVFAFDLLQLRGRDLRALPLVKVTVRTSPSSRRCSDGYIYQERDNSHGLANAHREYADLLRSPAVADMAFDVNEGELIPPTAHGG